MSQRGSNKKVANSLVAMSSAAVLAVYAAGYTRTRAAAERLDAQSAERRPAPTVPDRTSLSVAEFRAPVTAAPVVTQIAPVVPPPALKSAIIAPADGKAPAPAIWPAEVPEPSGGSSPVPPAPAVAEPAPAPAPKPEPPPPPPAPKWKDGTYTGWGTSRHGDIQASVIIEEGRIKSATIAQCLTRYSCDIIDKLPPQVAQRQSPETDFVSGATQSTNAFYYGVVDALSKAK